MHYSNYRRLFNQLPVQVEAHDLIDSKIRVADGNGDDVEEWQAVGDERFRKMKGMSTSNDLSRKLALWTLCIRF
jgi:hypothetical protein